MDLESITKWNNHKHIINRMYSIIEICFSWYVFNYDPQNIIRFWQYLAMINPLSSKPRFPRTVHIWAVLLVSWSLRTVHIWAVLCVSWCLRTVHIWAVLFASRCWRTVHIWAVLFASWCLWHICSIHQSKTTPKPKGEQDMSCIFDTKTQDRINYNE